MESKKTPHEKIKMSSLNGSCGACIGKLLSRKYLLILAKGCFVQVISSS